VSQVFDFSRVPGPTPDEIKANDGVGALTYGTGTQQSPEYLASLDAAGLKHALVWEHNTDSILGGFDYGVAECQAWEASHPPGLVYLACDLNDGALAGRSIEPFCSGWCSVTREAVVGGYGPDDAMAQVWGGKVPKMGRWWGVAPWLENGAPNNDQANIDRWRALGASLVQLIGEDIAGTDTNLVLRDDWWATGGVTRRQMEDSMYGHDSSGTYLKDTSGVWLPISGNEARAVYGQIVGGNPITVLDLGTPMDVIASNAAAIASLKALGVIGTPSDGGGGPSPTPEQLAAVQAVKDAAAAEAATSAALAAAVAALG